MEAERLQDLLIKELSDLYDAEKQIVHALPRMIEAATFPELEQAFGTHLEETKGHVERLERVFEQLDGQPENVTCRGMQGLLAEGEEIIEEAVDEATRDAGLIAAAQKVEHYEIASYGTVRTHAMTLEHEDVAELLQQTLDEEGKTDKLLTELAVTTVNPGAAPEEKAKTVSRHV